MASPCGRKLLEICLGDIKSDLQVAIRQELKNSPKKQQAGDFTEVESLVLKTARSLFTDSLKDDKIKKKVLKLLRTKHIEIFEAAQMLRESSQMMQIVMEKNIYCINRHETQYLGIELIDPVCRVTLNKTVITEVPNTPDDKWPVHFGKFSIKHRVTRIKFSVKDSDLSNEERQERLEAIVLKTRPMDCNHATRTAGYLRRSFHSLKTALGTKYDAKYRDFELSGENRHSSALTSMTMRTDEEQMKPIENQELADF